MRKVQWALRNLAKFAGAMQSPCTGALTSYWLGHENESCGWRLFVQQGPRERKLFVLSNQRRRDWPMDRVETHSRRDSANHSAAVLVVPRISFSHRTNSER